MASAYGKDHLPWSRLMNVALGVLGWNPDVFWRATPNELRAALDGYLEKTGMKAASLDRGTITHLRALLQNEEAA